MAEAIPEIVAHYANNYVEAERLDRGAGSLERVRTEELLVKHLPPAPAILLDVGGGPGAYAEWLAELGYEVHLLDPVPLHVEHCASVVRNSVVSTPRAASAKSTVSTAVMSLPRRGPAPPPPPGAPPRRPNMLPRMSPRSPNSAKTDGSKPAPAPAAELTPAWPNRS